MFLWFNNVDLKLPFLLPVICFVVMAAATFITGAGQKAGSDVPSVPVLEISFCCALCAAGHHGGGVRTEVQWSSLIWRLGRSSLSSASRVELRRQPLSSEKGGRQPVSSIAPVNQLAEGQPQGAVTSVDAPSSSSSRLEAIREAVLQQLGVHPNLFYSEMMGWRADSPKWFVTGGGRSISERRWQPGPDCNLTVRFGVLHAISRDGSVISFLVCPVMRFVPSQLFI